MIWRELSVIAILSLYTILIFVSIFILLLSKKEDDIRDFILTEKISIVIPFRNEAENIQACLEGVIQQDYPGQLMEIILVDDNSEDNSKQLALDIIRDTNITYRLIDLKEQHALGKKTAIELAVSQSTGSIIVTRDADTVTKNNLWLKSIACRFKH